jgi:hypothetical protein
MYFGTIHSFVSFCVSHAQSGFASVDHLHDLSKYQKFDDLVGLSWEQIRATFPARLQQLADETYGHVQRSEAEDDLMEAFGVTDQTQTVASMSAEQRLQCLHLIMNDRCGSSILLKVIFFQCSVTLLFVRVLPIWPLFHVMPSSVRFEYIADSMGIDFRWDLRPRRCFARTR